MKTAIVALTITIYYAAVCRAATLGERTTTNLRPRDIIQNPHLFKVFQDETYPNRTRITIFEARWIGYGKKLEDFISLNDPNFPEIKKESKTLEAFNVRLVSSITDSPSQAVSSSQRPDGTYFQLVSKLYERLPNTDLVAKEGKSEISSNIVQKLFLVFKPSDESKEIKMPPGIFDIKYFKQQSDGSVRLEYVKRKGTHDPASYTPPTNVIITVSFNGKVEVKYDEGPSKPSELIPGRGPWSVIHTEWRYNAARTSTTEAPPPITPTGKDRNGVPRTVINVG